MTLGERVVWVQERERERRNCSLPPDYDTDVPGMPDLIPTNKNKGSQEQQQPTVIQIVFVYRVLWDGWTSLIWMDPTYFVFFYRNLGRSQLPS